MDSNDIANLIAKKLHLLFPDIKIYIDQIKQGLQKPCFFIWEINTSHNQKLGNRYQHLHNFVVRYFIDDENPYQKLRNMAEKLFDELELIKFDDCIFRCTHMNYLIDDGVLHFFFSVNVNVMRDLPKTEKMKDLEVKQNARY